MYFRISYLVPSSLSLGFSIARNTEETIMRKRMNPSKIGLEVSLWKKRLTLLFF